MGLPKNLVKPQENYTYPTERDYQDTSLSTIGALQVTDPAKSGKDYSITDPKVTKAATTGTTNGG